MAPHYTADTWAESPNYSVSTSQHGEDRSTRDMPSLPQSHDLVEPIAIVGFSLRFPENAISADSFWEMLMEGRCTATEFPGDRVSVDATYHPDENRRGTVSTICLAVFIHHSDRTLTLILLDPRPRRALCQGQYCYV